MTIKSLPKAWSSVGGAVCFVLADVAAATVPLEVRIESPAISGTLIGRKRMYAAADRSLTVNVAPYVRSILATGLFSGARRSAPVRIVVSGGGVATYTSPYVTLAAGREDLPVNAILSAGPADVVVGPADWDEISIATDAAVQPELVMERNGSTWVDASMDVMASKEMIAIPIDVDDCVHRLAVRAGIHTNFVDRFAVRLRLTSGGVSTTVERRYTIDRKPARGMRLAWVNRYGAVDFHTFPAIEKQTHRPAGTERMIASEPVDAAGAVWLAEILDAPAVWRMDGVAASELEAVDGAVVISPVRPTYVALDVKPKKR